MHLNDKPQHFDKCAAAHESEGRKNLAAAYRCDAQIARLTIQIRALIDDKAEAMTAHHDALPVMLRNQAE